MARFPVRTTAARAWEELQSFLSRDKAARWDMRANPVTLNPVTFERAMDATGFVVDSVVDYCVLRVTTDAGHRSCIPFVQVKWRGEPPLQPPSLSHWMPLWSFHPLAAARLIMEPTIPPIIGDHSVVMRWVIDTAARVCVHCRGGSRCTDHSLPPL